jgi:hypothetical protein
MHTRRWLLAFALAPFVFAACQPDLTEVVAGGSGEGASTTMPPPTPTSAPGEEPADVEGLVVRVDQGRGAFTTAPFAFAQIPTFLLTEDGRVIGPGAQILIYPPPLLPALQAAQLTAEQAAAVVALADRHRIVGDFTDTTLTSVIADIGSTVVRVQRDGVVSTWDVYGLGMTDDRLPPDIAEKHRALSAFIAELTAQFPPPGSQGELFDPEQYAVGQLEVDLGSMSSDVAPTVRPWPAAFGDETERCQVLDGDVVRAELASANQLTFFERSDGSTVQVLLRPLLPGSDTCDRPLGG